MEQKYKKQSACVVLINEEGLILGVSRKDDHSDFGLVGGTMDPEDGGDPKVTAIRECKEETGLDIYDLQLVFSIHKGGNMGYTYLAKYKGEIHYDEPHVVKWLPFKTLVRGRFGRYNQLVAESLDDMDIDYVYRPSFKGN
jgi:8-oxo-dGTP pyrophosphatase MutT (NUDIX family)